MMRILLLNRLIYLYWIALSNISIQDAVAVPQKLMNANRVPLEALSTPGNFYFLEFPVNEIDSGISPICADGTPFSFAFRRGTDEHFTKLIIEFEGGPACWDNGQNECCNVNESGARKQVPWYNYYDFFRDQVVFKKTMPELGSCKGVSSGFLTEASDVILPNGDPMRGDLPIALRSDLPEGWWEHIGGEVSDIRDWSYILLPHCSMDWFLGHQENPQLTRYCDAPPNVDSDAIYQRGGTNVDAVIKWVQKQFPSGLEALVTTAGGKVGGCTSPAMASSIAPAILAAKLSPKESGETDIAPSLPSTLVVTEGSDLWNPDLPSPQLMASRWNAIDLTPGQELPDAMDNLVASSSSKSQFIWMASEEGKASNEETLWFMRQVDNHPEKFHLYEPRSIMEENGETNWCPLYTFPDYDTDVSEFFSSVIENMSWSSVSAPATSYSTKKVSLSMSDDSLATSGESRSQLTILTISIIISGLVILSWIIYFIIKNRNSRKGKTTTLSPTDLWFIALTKYPLAFYFVSLLVPIVLSTLAFYQKELVVNMDFDSYLKVNTDLENVKRNYNKAQESQQASLEMEDTMCRLYGNSVFSSRKLFDGLESDIEIDHETQTLAEESIFGSENYLDDFDIDIQVGQRLPFDMLSSHHRELSTLNYFSGGEWVSIMYQNRNGGNVFEPDVLQAIHEFESSIYEFPEFSDYCFGIGPTCLPVDSLVTYFFNNGELIGSEDARNAILRSFLVNKPALWKLDQYFGPDNLQSNVVRSFIFLKDMGGDQSAAHPFLKKFYRDFLLKHDQENTYPAMVHTWNNFVLKQTEADDALFHDTLWSIGSLCFIALMILLKVQSFFVVCSSMLGLVLAFSVAYYWVAMHFMIQDITLIWVAGLFVMLGIGADDIFLMVDSFEHTKQEFKEDSNICTVQSAVSKGCDDDDRATIDANIEILQKRMKAAYTRAGSMMLVSSVTTSICFFSNAFGVLTVIQEFGIFMG
jgi:predicted RND superfamily exporter protein